MQKVAHPTKKVEVLPEYKRTEQVQPVGIPDIGNSVRGLATADNSLSMIGATVAQSASTALATQYGNELAQHPNGDLLPPITDFDKQVAQVYHAQAGATLSLQGQKLLSDADFELGKATKLTPDLINKVNNQVNQGLNSIIKQAPSAIKGQLGARFSAVALQQNHQYQMKMFRQQREDQFNMLVASGREDAKSVYELASNGNVDQALKVAEETKQRMNVGIENGLITPQVANTLSDTARLSALHGKYIYIADAAYKSGNLEEFYKNFTENKPSDLSNEEWQTTAQAISTHIGTLNNLKNEYDDYRLTQFKISAAKDPAGITGDMLSQIQKELSPRNAQQAELVYIKALREASKNKLDLNQAIVDFTDINKFANLTTKQKDDAFQLRVNTYMEKNNVSEEEAQASVAAMAPGMIPSFIDQLNSRLASIDPNKIESAGISIANLESLNKAQNLGIGHGGLSDQSIGMYFKYNALRNSMQPVEAAKLAHDAIYGTDLETKISNDHAWTSWVNNKTYNSNKPLNQIILQKAGISTSIVRNANAYGNKLANVYETYFKITNGDEVTANKMLNLYVKQTFGETNINGQKETVYLPIERVVGVPQDGVGIILDDAANQLANIFTKNKNLYDSGKINSYWEVIPRLSGNEIAHIKAESGLSNKMSKSQIDKIFNSQKAKLLTEQEILDTLKSNGPFSFDLKEGETLRDVFTKNKESSSDSKSSSMSTIFDMGNLNNSLLTTMRASNVIDKYNQGIPIKIAKYSRGAEKPTIYEVVFTANPWLSLTDNPKIPIAGGWTVSIKTDKGMRDINLEDPSMGTISYRPNIENIQNQYRVLNQIKDNG